MPPEATTVESTELKHDQAAEQPEELSQEEKDAEAGFAAGFAKARGEEPPAQEQAKDETTPAAPAQAEGEPAASTAAPAAPAAAPAAPVDPWASVPQVVRDQLESLKTQNRNLAGQIGGLNSQLRSALATAKAAATQKSGAQAAPSEKQIQQAAANPEAWKRLKEDYPDWAEPLEAEFGKLRQEIQQAKAPRVDVNALKSEVASVANRAISAGLNDVEERVMVRMKHPDWQHTVNTTEFREWSLQGGPSLDAYGQMKQLERTDPARAETVVNMWARQFPQWWADRGAAIFDPHAEGAIKILDGFKSRNEQQPPPVNQKRQQNQTRLERAVPARASGAAPPSAAISDEAAFERGFKNARK